MREPHKGLEQKGKLFTSHILL